jgi:hypothetical protein
LKSGGNDSHAIVLEQAFGPFDLLRGLAWVFGGYLGVTILGLVVGPRVFKKELVRLSALGVYAVAARLLDALVAECILHALSDHFLALAGVGTLVVFAAGVPTEALQALFGIAGTGIALLALIILGNPATGVWRSSSGAGDAGRDPDLPRASGCGVPRIPAFAGPKRIANPNFRVVKRAEGLRKGASPRERLCRLSGDDPSARGSGYPIGTAVIMA